MGRSQAGSQNLAGSQSRRQIARGRRGDRPALALPVRGGQAGQRLDRARRPGDAFAIHRIHRASSDPPQDPPVRGGAGASRARGNLPDCGC